MLCVGGLPFDKPTRQHFAVGGDDLCKVNTAGKAFYRE